MLNILSKVDADDLLSAKLTCKYFNANLKQSLSVAMREKYTEPYERQRNDADDSSLRAYLWQSPKDGPEIVCPCAAVVRAHAAYENNRARGTRLPNLMCSGCGKVKSRNKFMEFQRAVKIRVTGDFTYGKKAKNRLCNSCGMFPLSFQ